MLIYPIPFENVLHIEVSDKLLGKAYSLLDSQGKIVLKGWLIRPKTDLNIGNLPQGEYFLQVESEPQTTTKLINR
ncbi:MAG: T9SS type A sorting domain-containing protein [Bacteroidia bacterium]